VADFITDYGIIPELLRVDPMSVTGAEHTILNRVRFVIFIFPIWCCFMCIRDVLYIGFRSVLSAFPVLEGILILLRSTRLQITLQTYKHAINDLCFMENIANQLCSVSNKQSVAIQAKLKDQLER
jgi:hypothetical protein